MVASVLPPGWEAFGRLQHSLDTETVDANTLGGEEALTDLLDDFTVGFAPTADFVHRRFRSLRRNRSRKQRHRLALAKMAAGRESVGPDTARVDDADQLRFVHEHVTPEEWALLVDVAGGETSDAIAARLGKSAGQVRTSLCRLRNRIRPAA